MSLGDVLALAGHGVPGLDAAVNTVGVIYNRVRDVKVYRQQCNDLASRCRMLLLAVSESSADMEGTRAIEFADEVEATLSRIRRRIEEWAAYSRVRSLLNLNDIKDGIDAFYRQIDDCFDKFNIKINMELSKNHRNLAAIQESDRAELRELLQNIAMSVDELKAIQRMRSPAAVEIVQSIEEELDDPGLDASEKLDLQQGLKQIRQHTAGLPLMTDLTGQVERVSDYPVTIGTFNDIYIGKWADDRKVALRLPRSLPNHPDSQQRFEKEVEIWRRLQHPNICRLYGIAYFGSYAYMVSHWMDHGNAIGYVQNHTDVDRLRLLSEVASGMEYLHTSNIVHGDLRGANVLISKRGKACLSDFGFSKVLEQTGHGMSSTSGLSNARWSAPELIDPALIGLSKTSTSRCTDVWSFGMLCLELMTGLQPYSDIALDVTVAIALSKFQLPPRPGHLAISRGLTDDLWALMMQCWNKRPESRPSMTSIKADIKRLRGVIGSSPNLQPAFLASSPARIQADLIPESSSKPIPPKGSKSRPSTAGSSSSEFKGRHSSAFGLFNALKRHSRSSSSQQPSPPDSFLDMLHSPSSISPISSPVLPEIKSIGEDGDESAFGDFYSAQVEALSTFSQRRATHDHPVPRIRGGSMQERSVSRRSNLQIPTFSSSLPRNSELHMQPMSALEDKPPSMLSMDSSSASTSSGTLDSTASNEPPPVLRAKDGSIEAATLEGLIEQLIADFSYITKAVEYRDTFFTTYVAFTTADDVFQCLVRRFHYADMSHGQHRALSRINIITIMKYWVTHPHLDVGIIVLTQIREFAMSIESSERMKELAKELYSVTTGRLQSPPNSPILSHPPPSPTVTQPTDPRDLAIALVILEGDKYTRILPADCIFHLQRQSGKSTIKAASETNNKIVNWVKQGILRCDGLENRSEVLKFFVHTAEESRNFRNFASMSAIVTALQSTTITRLGLTYDRLPRDARHMLEEMSGLLDPRHNHSAYRTVLRGSDNQPCIPLFAVHIHDMHTAFFQGKDMVEINGIPMINFTKWIAFHGYLKDVFRHKPPDVSQYRQTKAGVLAYLEHQLRGISVGSIVDQALEERSSKLRQREDLMRQLRIPELHAVGMR